MSFHFSTSFITRCEACGHFGLCNNIVYHGKSKKDAPTVCVDSKECVARIDFQKKV